MALVDDDGWYDGSVGQDGCALPCPPFAVCAMGWKLDANANALKAAGPGLLNIDPDPPLPSPLTSPELAGTLVLVLLTLPSILYLTNCHLTHSIHP
jgi:hypothetical protein